MSILSKRNLGSALAATMALVALLPCQLRASDMELYEGSWNWAPQHKKTVGKNTKSIVAFRPPASFRYCYLTNCWTSKANIGPDGSMSIERGKNYFEFSSPKPGVLNGRFWFDISPPVHAPDATITMRQTF